MIKGLDIAAHGLLQAQKRADKAASNIVADVSSALNPPLNKSISDTGPNRNITASTKDLSPNVGGNLIQDIVDLKTAKIAFGANAKVFRSISDTLGKLLDDES